jgi:ABC-type polysaccharide/polyol phosphate export permease
LEIIQKTIADLKKYQEYLFTSITTGMRTDFANTYIGYIWWILDPLLFMLVYVFVFQVIMGSKIPNYPVFLMCSLLFWRWISGSIAQSTSSIVNKKAILSQTYIPKFLLPLIKIGINSMYFLFSILVLLVFIVIYRIPVTWHFIEIIPLTVVSFLFCYAVGLWLAHLGVFYYDVERILQFVLRLWYYVSPGVYALANVPKSLTEVIWLNPLTPIFEGSRNVFLYGLSPDYKMLGIWTLISLVMIYFGLKKLRQFDKTYTKIF